MKVKPAMCWAIRVPSFSGRGATYIASTTVRATRTESIRVLFGLNPKTWRKYYLMGYRCVKVVVEDMEADP